MNSTRNISGFSDEDLISKYQESGDNQFIGILFKRYSHLVLGVCLKYLKDEDDSKDATMQVFEKLFIELKRHQVQHFKAWLHTVTKYHCLMKLRSAPKEKSGYDSFIMENEAEKHPMQVTIEERLEKESQLQRMEDAMTHLDEHQQICIRLFYLQEKSYQQVSEITGYNMNQVKSYIQNGKRNLKMALSKNE